MQTVCLPFVIEIEQAKDGSSGVIGNKILKEEILSFIVRNWGNLASVLGAILTVIYARGANSSAKAAKLAADNAKSRIDSIDLVLHFNSIIGDIDILMHQVGSNADWHNISNNCVRLRSSSAVAFKEGAKFFGEDMHNKLQQSPTQFGAIAKIADSECRDRTGAVDIVRIRKILATQRELFSLCLEASKHRASGGTAA